MSGPASGVMAAAATLGAGRHRQRHHLRHGRHLDRRRADPRRRAAGVRRARPSTTACRSTCRWSTCARVGAGGGSIASVDAAGHAAGRAAERRRRARADLLRPRRHASRPSPTPTSCSAGSTRRRCWRSTQPVPLRRVRGDLRRRSSAAPLGLDAGRRRRGRDPARQHAHGRRDPHGVAVARLRPARLHAVRLRRRRAAARRRRWRASSACRRSWCRRGRASPTRSAASSPTCARTSSTRSTRRSTALDMGEVARHPRGAARARRARSTPRSRARSSRRSCCTAPTCSSAARRTSSAWPCRAPDVRARRDAGAVRGGLLRPLPGRLPEIKAVAGQPHHLGDRQAPAASRSPALIDTGKRARAPGGRRHRPSARSTRDGGWQTRTSTTASSCRPTRASRARRSSSRSTPRP